MKFSEIPGLNDVKTILIKSVQQNHVAHALLIHGLSGSAALPMALAFASYINCQNKNELDSCGICASCLKMQKIAHPDVNYVFPTAGGKKVLSENFMNEWRSFLLKNPFAELSNWLNFIEIKQGNIPVEDTRQVILNLSLKSYEGGYKIVLIWQPEFMGASAANALLKVLEEPPEKTLFLLVSNAVDRLLPTIISRTQSMRIPELSTEELTNFLTTKYNLENTRAEEIAFLSDGSINGAINLLENEVSENKQLFAFWMRACYAFDLAKLVPLADEFDGLGKENQRSVLNYSLKMLRDIYLNCTGASALIKLPQEEMTFVQNFSKAFKFENMDKIIDLISEAIFHIERNARAKIVFLDISLNIAKFIK